MQRHICYFLLGMRRSERGCIVEERKKNVQYWEESNGAKHAATSVLIQRS